MASFNIQPLARFEGASTSIRRPREFTYFSYDENRKLYPLSDQSLQYYYPPFIDTPSESDQGRPPIDLSNGFDTFRKHDDSVDEHLDSLLETVMAHEQNSGQRVKSDILTWRGIMTKIMTAPFDLFNEFELNATSFQGTVFIEENHASKAADIKSQRDNSRSNNRRGPSQEMMQYWGYKFESISLLSTPWADATREEIENRDLKQVDSEAQYCSIVTTGIGGTSMILGGEVDAVMGAKPDNPNDPIPWVELKTAQQPATQKDDVKYERKLLKFWAQSFLLGVPKIVVGFRSPNGHLLKLMEHETQKIPSVVKRQGQGTWDGNTCINFAAAMLEFIKATVQGDGVWRIQRRQKDGFIEAFRVDGIDPNSIVTPSFRAHRERIVAKEVAAML
ncbi:hypothetical protein Q7P37_004925 [Cladosporium fusiforme]